MRLTNDVIRFLTALSVVFLFYTPSGFDNLSKTGDLVYTLPFVILPFVGMLVWLNTLKTKKHVPVPGFYFALLVVVTVLISLSLSGAGAYQIMSALTMITPCLLLPILFQGMISSRDRRGLRSLMIALLVVTLINLLIQMTVVRPSISQLFDSHPEVLAKSAGVDVTDAVGMGDLKRRVNTVLYEGSSIHVATGHFETANVLAIVLLMLAAFARSIKKNIICGIALFLMLFACQSKGIVLVFLLTLPLNRKRPDTLRALCAGIVVSLLLWETDYGTYVVDYLKNYPLLASIEFRVSYWMTAHNMSDFYGPVGLGQYEQYASAARVKGGHYAALPHNGFLKLVAELGVFAAASSFVWLSGLFRGKASRRKEGGAPRISVVAGATVAMAWMLFYGNITSQDSVFNLGLEMVGGTIQQRWQWMVYVYCLALLIIFVTVWWMLQKKVWKVGNGSLAFAAAACALHQFIEMDLNHAAILMLFFVLASIGWLRRPSQNKWTWHFFPILCLLCLVGFKWVVDHLDESPSAINKKIAELPSKDVAERKALLKQWHTLKPLDERPIKSLIAESVKEEKIYWLKKLVATEPANPSHHLYLARTLMDQGESVDVLMVEFKKARDLDNIKTLKRYKLRPEEREILNRCLKTLEERRYN